MPSGLCVAHDADHAAFAKFQAGPAHQPGPGGIRKPGTLDAMVALVERQPERFLGVVWEALAAVRPDGTPDYDTRLRALQTALDRAYGKPKQAVDVDHTSGGKTLEQLFAPSPLGQSHSELPVDEPEGWEGTDG